MRKVSGQRDMDFLSHCLPINLNVQNQFYIYFCAPLT